MSPGRTSRDRQAVSSGARKGAGWGTRQAWVLAAVLLWVAPGAQASSGEGLPAPALSPFVGVVVATQALVLTSQAEGRMTRLEVRLGDHVASGQVVAVVDLEPLQLEVNARQANFKAAEAELQRVQVLQKQAQQRLDREQRIREHTSKEAFESAQTDLDLATANVALASARRAEAQARLAQAQLSLDNARVRAPFAGHVTECYQPVGSMIGRGTPLIRLVSDELRLRFAVPENQTASVRPGSTVQVLLPVLGMKLEAKVERLAPEVDPSSRHQKAEARLIIPEPLRDRVAVGLLAEVVPVADPTHAATSTSTPP